MADAQDTLRVYGGRALNRVDADEVRACALRVGIVANYLSDGAADCHTAAAQLDLAAAQFNAEAATLESGLPAFQAAIDQTAWLQRQNQISDLRHQAQMANRSAAELQPIIQRLSSLASDALDRRDRLLKAAGLYEHQESKAAISFSSLLKYGTAARVYWATKFPQFAALDAIMLGTPIAFGAVLAQRQTKGNAAKAASKLFVRRFAPISDEVVGGLSLGLAARYPELAGGSLTTTGGVGVLATVGTLAVRPGRLRVSETMPGASSFGGAVFPGSANALLTAATPHPPAAPAHNSHGQPKVLQYQGTPSGDVLQALNRVGDLHPFDPTAPAEPGAAYPLQGRGGLPNGTIGVERVEHSGGSISWTVLIPGTQNFAPGSHAFDGLTDLDLMAHRQSQVGEQVIQALEQVGVGPLEPVVLVGHSLGGIAAMSLASSPVFTAKYQVGGVITAGSPTATFAGPPQPGVPILHLENDEEIVSNLDGESGAGNPHSADRVTVTRQLAASDDPIDKKAADGLAGAHPIETHQRTYELAIESGNAQVLEVTERLNSLLAGEKAHTRYFTGRRE